jgi:type IV pilus assembly protein PilO
MAGLPKGQREQGLLLVCIVAFAAMFLYWYFVFSPRAATLDAMSAHAEALVTVNQKAKSEMAKGNLDELRKQLADYQQNLALVRTLVPTGNEVPALLEQVSTAARHVGLDIATVDPQPVIDGENYDTYRYTISVVGGYHDLAEFLTNVGNLTRIVLPVNVSLQLSNNQAAQKMHAKKDAAVIEARFQLQTFVTKTAQRDPTLGNAKKGGAKT